MQPNPNPRVRLRHRFRGLRHRLFTQSPAARAARQRSPVTTPQYATSTHSNSTATGNAHSSSGPLNPGSGPSFSQTRAHEALSAMIGSSPIALSVQTATHITSASIGITTEGIAIDTGRVSNVTSLNSDPSSGGQPPGQHTPVPTALAGIPETGSKTMKSGPSSPAPRAGPSISTVGGGASSPGAIHSTSPAAPATATNIPLVLPAHHSPGSAAQPMYSMSNHVARFQARANVHATIEDLQRTHKINQRRQRYFENRRGEKVVIADRLGKILKGLNEYAKIIDVAVQHSPEITALVWAGVRTILTIALNCIELHENLELAMGVIIEKMANCEFYGQIYVDMPGVVLNAQSTTEALKAKFDNALSNLYGAVLNFTAKAEEYMDPRMGNSTLTKIGQLIKPFAIVMKPLIDDISEKERIVRECADMALMGRVKESSGKLNDIKSLLVSIQNEFASLTRIEDILHLLQGNLTVATETLSIAREVKSTTDTNLDVTRKVLSLSTDNVRMATENLVLTQNVEQVVLGMESQVNALVHHQHRTLFGMTTLDVELQELKMDYLAAHELMEEFHLDLYVPARGMNHPVDPEVDHFDLITKLDSFLQQETLQTVCLIQGVAGSGKSTFNHHLARRLWEDFDKALQHEDSSRQSLAAIPVFISLAGLHDPTRHNQDLVAAYFHARGMSEEHIRQLRHARRFVFILDGYDEIEKRDRNFYLDNKLGNWKAKVVITSRPEYLGVGYQSKFYPQQQRQLLVEYWIAPFSVGTITEYITRYVKARPTNRSVEDYKRMIARPAVAELVRNPFFLRMVMTVEPNPGTAHLARGTLYSQFIDHWLEQAHQRLQNTVQLSTAQREAFSKLCDDKAFTEHVRDFCQQFALALYRVQALEASYDSALDLHEVYIGSGIDGPRTGNAGQYVGSPWKRFLGSSDDRIRLLRFSSPLTRNQPEQSYRFIHKSIRDYFVAQSLWQDPCLVSAPVRAELNKLNIVEDPGVLDFVVEYATTNTAFCEICLAVVEASKTKSIDVACAAANAITVLVRARQLFTGQDLRGICVRGANLSRGWFERTQMQGADLTNVRMHGTWLRQADLAGADMTGASFGERSFLNAHSLVSSLTFFANGERLGVSTRGRTGRIRAHIWSLDEMRHHWALKFPTQIPAPSSGKTSRSPEVTCLAFSPDGSYICVGTTYGGIIFVHYPWPPEAMWDQININEIRQSKKRTAVQHLVFSPCGTMLASVDSKDKVSLWRIGAFDAASGAGGLSTTAANLDLLHILGGSAAAGRYIFTAITFSPCAKWVAAGTIDGTVELWSTVAPRLEHTFQGDSSYSTGPILNVAFAPDGTMLAGGTEEEGVLLWSLAAETRDQVGALYSTDGDAAMPVLAIAFSPNSQLLASGGLDTKVRLWSVSHRTLVATFQGHLGPVGALNFSVDGQVLASGSQDGFCRLWEIPAHRLKLSQELETMDNVDVTHNAPVALLSFSPDGSILASGGCEGTVRVRAVEGNNRSFIFPGPTFGVFLPNGSLLAWSVHQATLHGVTISEAAHSPMDVFHDVNISGSGRCDHNQMHEPWRLEFTQPLQGAAVSFDGSLFAVCTSDTRLKTPTSIVVRAIPGRRIVHSFVIPEEYSKPKPVDPRCLAFSPKQITMSFLASSFRKVIYVWSLEKNQLHCALTGHEGIVSSLVFSPDGLYLASGSADGTLNLWRIPSDNNSSEVGKPPTIELARSLKGHEGLITSVSFSHNGELLASGGDNTVRIWLVQLGDLIGTVKVDPGWVSMVAWGPKNRGDYFAVGTQDGQTQIWRLIRRVDAANSAPTYDFVCQWVRGSRTLVAEGLNIENVIGLETHTMQLLTQRGASGIPAGGMKAYEEEVWHSSESDSSENESEGAEGSEETDDSDRDVDYGMAREREESRRTRAWAKQQKAMATKRPALRLGLKQQGADAQRHR